MQLADFLNEHALPNSAAEIQLQQMNEAQIAEPAKETSSTSIRKTRSQARLELQSQAAGSNSKEKAPQSSDEANSDDEDSEQEPMVPEEEPADNEYCVADDDFTLRPLVFKDVSVVFIFFLLTCILGCYYYFHLVCTLQQNETIYC